MYMINIEPIHHGLFKVSSQHFLRGTEKNYELARKIGASAKFQAHTSQI